jgi:hypothetical protein
MAAICATFMAVIYFGKALSAGQAALPSNFKAHGHYGQTLNIVNHGSKCAHSHFAD